MCGAHFGGSASIPGIYFACMSLHRPMHNPHSLAPKRSTPELCLQPPPSPILSPHTHMQGLLKRKPHPQALLGRVHPGLGIYSADSTKYRTPKVGRGGGACFPPVPWERLQPRVQPMGGAHSAAAQKVSFPLTTPLWHLSTARVHLGPTCRF